MSGLAVIFNRLGPYHRARLEALAASRPVTAIELYEESDVYGWEKVTAQSRFRRVTLFPGQSGKQIVRNRLIKAVNAALSQIEPEAVAIPGWADKGALAALCWCSRTRTPAILMSESGALDEPRRAIKESIKRQLLRLYSAALVGGKPHRDYLLQLGFAASDIFQGYDVVDNTHFWQGATEARNNTANLRAKLQLPDRYFLASCRFVQKKNLERLTEAYAIYKRQAKDDVWSLVLLGDGPLRARIEAQIRERGLSQHVGLHGFRQYAELPAYYGLAKAFVHASTSEQWGLVVNEAMAAGLPVLVSERCGCVVDLVVAGRNGLTFDPLDEWKIAESLKAISSARRDLDAMGAASREIIASWSPAKFAAGMQEAVECAMRKRISQPGILERFSAELLARV
jgi:glycosyltransferase involved in cell wall biosynthesis